jgi:hypothetical protein
MSLSHELNKWMCDDIHQHHLAESAAREASSKRVKETAASHKSKSKEKALGVTNKVSRR